MMAQSLVPGVRIRDLAQRNGICASLIYRWRREGSAAAAPAQLVPVRIASERPTPDALVSSPQAEPQSVGGAGLIEIEFADGVRVRVDEDVSPPALRRVVAAPRERSVQRSSDAGASPILSPCPGLMPRPHCPRMSPACGRWYWLTRRN